MNRRNFLKSATTSLVAIPSVALTSSKPKELEYDRKSHLLGGTYFTPYTLFTPEEIVEAGFVFVNQPAFIHQWDNPTNPMMDFREANEKNEKRIVCKTSRCCEIGYTKTYDYDVGRWRGIEGVQDYISRRDIFKPQIVNWMKNNEFHYVYSVSLEQSPCFYVWQHDFSKRIFKEYMHAIHVRGCRLPIKN